MIAILCPTRGRPTQFKRMKDSVTSTIGGMNNAVRIYACTNGDDDYVFHKFPVDCPTVHMWNSLAQTAMSDHDNKLFMLGSDDTIFTTPLWNEALVDHYNALENKIHVYALRDSRDLEGTPHPIVTREYINAMGYFIPPIFNHWFCDTWTAEIAKANDCFTHLKDYLLVHDKPSDRGEADNTHNHIRSMGWRERDKAVNDSCQHYLKYEKERLSKAIAASSNGRTAAFEAVNAGSNPEAATT